MATASPTAAPASTGAGLSGNGASIAAGTALEFTSFAFALTDDILECFTTDSAVTVGFAGTNGGEIFVWSMQAQPVTVSPVYVNGDAFTRPEWKACQASPDGTQLYLLDDKNVLFNRYTVATAGVAPVVISSFPDEDDEHGLWSLAIDFTSGMAYIGTYGSDNVYAVNISMTGQTSSAYYAYPLNSRILSLALSQDGLTLYYASPAPAEGVPATINSLDVQAGSIPYPGYPTVVYSSLTLFYPDSLLVSGSTLIFKDGGFWPRYAPSNGYPREVYSLTLGNSSLTTLFRSTVVDLPSGLVLAADFTRLYFTTWSTVGFVQLVAQPVPTASLCVLTYSLPGNADYPWSTATQVQVSYLATAVTTSMGPAVVLLSGNGTRTYTNRFGSSSTTPVTLSTAGAATSFSLLYLNATTPFDSTGVAWRLPSAIQLPGVGPQPTTSVIAMHSAGGVLVEGGSTRVDAQGQAWLSFIPGFVSATIPPSNINALAVDYAACSAPITCQSHTHTRAH